MSKKYDLLDYKFAKEVAEDFPVLLQYIDELKMKLLPYMKYVTVRALMDDLTIKTEQLYVNVKYSTDVVKKKGSRDV